MDRLKKLIRESLVAHLNEADSKKKDDVIVPEGTFVISDAVASISNLNSFAKFVILIPVPSNNDLNSELEPDTCLNTPSPTPILIGVVPPPPPPDAVKVPSIVTSP